MNNDLLQDLADKKITKEQLYKIVKSDDKLIPYIKNGVHSSKAIIRYGCAKILMDLSKENPEKLYDHMDFFIDLLDSKYRILCWNAIIIIANLTKIDRMKKFDKIFDKYFSFLNNDYMVTVANIVGSSSKIALAKPYLIDVITDELLMVEKIKTTPHLTEECKRVIVEKTIISFNKFFENIEDKEKVLSFVKKHTNSSRRTLKIEAENFIKKWSI
jgi:hypothetical protein